MAKTHTRYVCQECGRATASYMGKCPQCGAFNSMVEEIIHDEPVTKGTAVRGLTGRSAPRSIGGGIVPGSIVLIGGDPGIGKSTLMLQMAMEMAATKRVLYVSGEESERQIKMRATRLVGAQRDNQSSKASQDFAVPLPKNLLLV